MSIEIIQNTKIRPPSLFESSRILDCPVLVTERLVLRQPHIEDMDAIADLANNRKISAMLLNMPYPYTRKHAAEFILRTVAGEMGHCVYAITIADTGEFIGTCSIIDREGAEGYEMSSWIGQPYWNKGFATEAVSSLIDSFFRVSDVNELYVSCYANNNASKRLIQNAGFRFIDKSERQSLFSGTNIAENYVLNREEWLYHYRLNRQTSKRQERLLENRKANNRQKAFA